VPRLGLLWIGWLVFVMRRVGCLYFVLAHSWLAPSHWPSHLRCPLALSPA
jgi:hypothetical protein